MSSSPSQIPLIANDRDLGEDPPCPAARQSVITSPVCTLHAECELTSSLGTHHQSANQTQLTVEQLLQPILSELSAPDSSNSSVTAHAEGAEGLPAGNERIRESVFFPVQTTEVSPPGERRMDPTENPSSRLPAREEVCSGGCHAPVCRPKNVCVYGNL